MNLREIEKQMLEKMKKDYEEADDEYLAELIASFERSQISMGKDNSVFISITTDGNNATMKIINNMVSDFLNQLSEIEGVISCDAELGDNGRYGIYNTRIEGFQNIERKDKSADATRRNSPYANEMEDIKKEWEAWGKNGKVEDFKEKMRVKYGADGRTTERWIRKFRHP